MKTLRKLRPPAVVVLFALAASCEDTSLGGLLPRPCGSLIDIEPAQGLSVIMVSVGSSRQLRVRLRDESEVDLDLFRHCPSMSLDEFEWTVSNPSVARLEGHGEAVTVTGLAPGRATIYAQYGGYRGRGGHRWRGGHVVKMSVQLEVVESQSTAPASGEFEP